MPKKRPARSAKPDPSPAPRGKKAGQVAPVGLRIIGGTFRGRRLKYGGDLGVRPMKDRVREAVFNLIGPRVKEKLVIDLFGGTGALGLEALSRGATDAIFIERNYPTAAVLRENIATLGLESRAEVVTSDTFYWWWHQRKLPDRPRLVFCSPPYDFYIERFDDMSKLLVEDVSTAPAGSITIVESDLRFDVALLPKPGEWDVRPYPPALVAILYQ